MIRSHTPRHFFEDQGKAFVTIGLGCLASYPYLNKNKELDHYYHISTRPSFFAKGFYHKPISKRTALVAGVQIAQSKQGLAFKYLSGPLKVSEYCYNVSQMFRIPLGISYKITPSFELSAAAVLVYSAHLFYITNGSAYSDLQDSDLITYQYKWSNSFEDDKYYCALDFYGSKNVYKRFNLIVQASLDFHSSVALDGNAEILLNGVNIDAAKGRTDPSLMYFGMGVSYRFF